MATKKQGKTKSAPKQSVSVDSASFRQGNKDVSVRKIENGYVIRETEMRKNKYIEKERFSATNPIQIQKNASISFSKKK